MTERLYFKNPYQTEFEAEVVKKLIYEEKPALILNQTCFYPESGGQPADKGTINGIEVFHVLETDDQILHLIDREVTAGKIKGQINWPRRFDHMQQHSGQHILSQSFYELFSAETLSFHLGQEVSSIEVDLRNIKEEAVIKAERRANEIIFQNRPIKTYFVKDDELEKIPLRKPPKKRGLIRIVEVSEFDYSACGGTHLKRTGEIGLIKILKWERIRNNIRFEFVCGLRALKNFDFKNSLIRQLCQKFTVQETEILSSVERYLAELRTQRKINKKIQNKLIEYEAQDIAKRSKEKIIRNIFTDKTREEVKFLALSTIRIGQFVVIYGLREKERIYLILARSDSFNIDFRELVPELAELIKGKGGGQPSLVEMAGQAVQNLSLAVDKVYDFVKQKLR
ncbi:MAG: alanine--tRNA ligase-related protein [Candidatus Aminicenantales bacterium]